MKRCWMLWMAVAVVGLLAGEVMAAGTSTGAAKVGEKAPPPKAPRGEKPMPPEGMRPPAPPPLIEAIEAKLGKPLTDEQKTQIGEAAKAQHEATQPSRDAFLAKVAEIVGVPVEKLKSLLPKHGPPPPPPDGQRPPRPEGATDKGPPPSGDAQKPAKGEKPPRDGPPPEGKGPPPPPPMGRMLVALIEKELGKKLTEDQLGQVREVDHAMMEASKPAHEAFLAKVAEITGLSAEDIKSLMPPPPHGPPPEGAQKGDAKPQPPDQVK